MKRLLLLIILTILFSGIKSQTWAPSGASWHYEFNQMFSYGYIKVEYVGDTTVQGKNCKILQKTAYAYSYPGTYDTTVIGKEYTYLENDVVYYFNHGQFDTLYNFNAQFGASWKVRKNQLSTDSGKVIVDSIGYKIINADTLKSIFVSPAPGSCVGFYAGTEIVERIGCVNGYLLPDYVDCIMDAGEGGPLRCYSDDNFSLYQVDTAISCNKINGIDEHPFSEHDIQVYPNPFSDKFTIILPNKSIIEILNSQGQLINTFNNVENTAIIDLTDVSQGVYVIKIMSENYVAIKKIVKK